MACHHGNGPKGSKGSEYTTWIAHDPHARAFTVLYDRRSKLIEKNLRGLSSLEAAKPEADRLCLRCHAVDESQVRHGDRFALVDGVGCESCHGPAEKWLGQHYLPGWKQLTPAQKEAQGMRPTKDLSVRVQLCVECHVGTTDREVNHDLIAAGHPRLNFEFSAYLANLPKHWTEKDENAGQDFEARAWILGQVVSARAAVDLLAARAKAAAAEKPTAPWPEFAEYDCFACHHGLRDEKWRRERDFSRQPPGSTPWASWYTALLPAIAGRQSGTEAKQSLAAMQDLEKLMSQPNPEPVKVAEKARSLGKLLGAWSQTVGKPLSAPAVRELFTTLAQDKDKATAGNWDAAAQTYLALAALHQAARESQPDRETAVQSGLRRLLDAIRFPAGYDSPRAFEPARFETELRELSKHRQ